MWGRTARRTCRRALTIVHRSVHYSGDAASFTSRRFETDGRGVEAVHGQGTGPRDDTNRRAAQPDVHRLRVPNLNELDFDRLRTGRLERLQQKLRLYDLPACLLFSPANIRYATGTDVMGVWTAGTLRSLLPRPGGGRTGPVRVPHFDARRGNGSSTTSAPPSPGSSGAAGTSWEKVREWAREIKATLLELGLDGKRLAVDRLDAHGFLALQSEGIEVAGRGPGDR